MKIVRFRLSVMMAAALLPGARLAAPASTGPQPPISWGSGRSVDPQKGEVRHNNDRSYAKQNDATQARPAGATSVRINRPNTHISKPDPSRQARLTKVRTNKDSRMDVPGTASKAEQMGPNMATNIPSKVISRRGLFTPSTAVSVNGLQLESPRDPGALRAISGGPPRRAVGTAAINGTNMKRRP